MCCGNKAEHTENSNIRRVERAVALGDGKRKCGCEERKRSHWEKKNNLFLQSMPENSVGENDLISDF